MASKKVNITLPRLSSLNIEISSLNIEIKLDGDWQALDKLSNTLQQTVYQGYEKGIATFSNRLVRIIRRSLRTGTPPPNSGVVWAPHSPATIAKWGEHTLLNLTGQYSETVGLYKYKSRTLIGLPINTSKVSRYNNKITLNQLAIILEYGTNRIPARPLYAPAYKSVGGRRELKKELLKNIRSQLYKDTGIRANQVRGL